MVSTLADDDFTYAARLQSLRQTKRQQTQEKLAAVGYMDGDDHGRIQPPAGFSWQAPVTRPDGTFFGAAACGRNFRSLLEAHPVYVNPDDALTGRWMFCLWGMRKLTWPHEYDAPHLREEQQRYGIVSGIGAPHHFGIDYRIGLRLGWGGLLARVRQTRELLGPAAAAEFLTAEEDVILGAQAWIRHTVERTRELEASETRPGAKRNLAEMAEVNLWLLEQPPRTLREACQWIAWFNMVSRDYNGDGAGGQLDELLRPYYERGKADGTLTDEDAIFLIACLLLNDTHYYQLGGPDADGHDLTSPISFLILEAAHRLQIACNLTIRVHAGLDPHLFMKGVEHLFVDRLGWPRFSGDKGLVEGFMKNGYSVELARQRIAVGCHWMSLQGLEYTLNDCVKINAGKVFEAAFQELEATAATTPPTVDRLWRCFEQHLDRAVRCTADGLDWHMRYQRYNYPELLVNLLCYGPVERGLDASCGGVDYYNLCVDGSALATVADSFAALEQRLEREQVLTWPEIFRHIRNNYADADGERVRLMMKHAERFGRGGGALGDVWAQRISQRFTELVKQAPTPDGFNMIPGWFSWSNTIPMGKALGTTPNGRRAGEPISHGANPDPGFRRDGAPTAMAEAIAAVQPGYGNTAPIQLEMDPGISRREGGIEKVAGLIKAHFDLGGTLFNINVLDKARLQAAHQDPAKDPDLVVRVTGFTAFFCTLSPQFRQLVMDRFIAEA